MSERNVTSTSKTSSTSDSKFAPKRKIFLPKSEQSGVSISKSESCPLFKLPETTQPITFNDVALDIQKTLSETTLNQDTGKSAPKNQFGSPDLEILASCGTCCPSGSCCGNPADCNCGAQLPPPCNTPPRCLQHMAGYYYYPYGTWFCGPYHVAHNCAVPCSCKGAGPCCCGVASCSMCSDLAPTMSQASPSSDKSSKPPDSKAQCYCGLPTCSVCSPPASSMPQAYSSQRSPTQRGSDFYQTSKVSATPGSSPSSDNSSKVADEKRRYCGLPHCSVCFPRACCMSHINRSWGSPGHSGSGYQQISEASGAAGSSPNSYKSCKAAGTSGFCGLPHCSVCFPQASTMSHAYSAWGSPGHYGFGYPQTSESCGAPGSRSTFDKSSKTADIKSKFCGLPNCGVCCPQASTTTPQTYNSWVPTGNSGSGFPGTPGTNPSQNAGSTIPKAYNEQTFSQKAEASQPVVYPPIMPDTSSSLKETSQGSQDQIVEKPRCNAQTPCYCSECDTRKVTRFLEKTKSLTKTAGRTVGDTKLAWRGINSELMLLDSKEPNAKTTDEVIKERPNYCEMLNDPKYTV